MEREIFLLLALIVAVGGVVIGGALGLLGWIVGLPDLWKLGFLFFWPGMTVILWCRYREGRTNK